MVALKFILAAFISAFSIGTILMIYESVKSSGYKRGQEKLIIIFSVILGILFSFVLFLKDSN